MKAVVLHEYGGPDKLRYEDWEDPAPGPGEVLVRVSATSLNPTVRINMVGAQSDPTTVVRIAEVVHSGNAEAAYRSHVAAGAG